MRDESTLNNPNKNDDKDEFHPIVFYDGVCGCCNRFVDILLKIDDKQTFHYAQLQGETAREYDIDPKQSNPDNWTVSYRDEMGKSYKSEAVINILIRLGGIFSVAKIFVYIPESVRDSVYEFIAKHRYRLFGTVQACRIPKEEERSVMLP